MEYDFQPNDHSQEDHVVQDMQELGRLQALKERAGSVALASFVALEVNPITNEGMRLSAFAAAHGSFHNPYVTAATFAGATLAIEGAGAFATAKLLASDFGGKTITKMNNVLEKMHLAKLMKTNVATEAALAAVAGAPAAMVVKHSQSPERSQKDNLRYGTVASLGITAMSGAQGYLVAEGISAPSPATIGSALAAVGASIGAAKWLKRKTSKNIYEGDQ